MSSNKEKIEAIKRSLRVTKKEIEKLELMKEVSKLHKTQELKLDMAKYTYDLGVKLLKEHGETL